MIKEKFPNRVTAHDFAVIGNKVYYSSLNSNALYCYDINTGKNEFQCFFPEENLDIRHLHSAVAQANHKLYFAPMNGKCISIYDTVSQNIKAVNITCKVGNISSKYYGICTYKNMIYMIPSRAEYIVKINSDTDEITFHNEWLKDIDFHKREYMPAVKNGAFIHNEKLYMPYLRKNLLITVALTGFSTNVVKIGDGSTGFTDAIFDCDCEKKLWLLVNGNYKLMEYSLDSKEYKEIYLCDSEKKCDYPFIKMLNFGKKIIFVPYQADEFIIFDKSSKKTDIIRRLNDNGTNNEWGVHYYSAKKISDFEFIAMRAGDYNIEKININGEITGSYVMNSSNIANKAILAKNNFIKENTRIGLKEFIDFITAEAVNNI